MNAEAQNQVGEQTHVSPEIDHFFTNILAVRDAIIMGNPQVKPDILRDRMETLLMLRIYSGSIMKQFADICSTNQSYSDTVLHQTLQDKFTDSGMDRYFTGIQNVASCA